MHDPIGAFSRIRAFYLSYLDTASRLEGRDIREERRKLLMETGTLCTSPLLEPLPSWEADGRSFEDLVTEEGEGAVLAHLSPKARRAFVDLIGCGLIDRDGHGELYRPYSHQIKMLERGVRDGQAGIVTSGTGSGKTEAFLLPVLASIIEEATRDEGGWQKPNSDYLGTRNRWWRGEGGHPKAKRNSQGNYELSDAEQKAIKGLEWSDYENHEQRCGEKRPAAIRALILYPMNALVEDQMTRLRMALDSQDARDVLDDRLDGNRIFFGRYTGQTKGGPSYLLEYEKALKNLRHGEGKKQLSHIIKGCNDKRTLTQWKASVTGSRKRRIEDVIIELSKLDDLESAIRKEAQIPRDQQVKLNSPKEIQDKAFAFPALDGAEMVTRWDMQEYPPDILVTNISMLNAMLSRNTEACMLEKTREWLESDPRNRFTLVIDELHLQRGSAGTEFMYLLRLLFVRLGLDRPEHHHQLRLLASSASLPADENDHKEKSLNYLYDAFADFGLCRGADRKDWIKAIIPGRQKCSTSNEYPQFSVNAADLNNAIDTLMNIWAPEDDEDTLLPEPNFKDHRNELTTFFNALTVPILDSLEERWEWLASAVGCAFEKACRRNDGSVVATSLDNIAERCWPEHGWSPSEIERNMRLLAAVVSAADHSGPTGQELRKLRQNQKECWPVPRFRLHTFFRIPQGLFVDVVPPAWRSQKKSGRWQGKLSIERSGTTQIHRHLDGNSYSVRQFELLSCECCGECFIGGVRAGQKDSYSNNDSIIEELLPNEEDIESLPDLSISNRFEEYNYENYVIFWPRDNNSEDFNDNVNKEEWKKAWLNHISGVIFKNSGEQLQPGYIFTRTLKSNRGGVTNKDPGSHTPCRCPRCKIDYGRKRGLKKNNLFQFSPLGSQRSGLERITQLLASELYAVLAGEGDSSKARLVSFSDSRQAAARTALGIEQLHHRDVLRDVLLKAILSESKKESQPDNESLELQREIDQKRRDGISDDSLVLKLLLSGYNKKIKIPALYRSLGIIRLESILELESPKLGSDVLSFLDQIIKLRIHPFCERGITKLRLPSPDNRLFDWWELFADNGNSHFKWSNSKLDDEDQYKKLCERFLKKVLGRISRIVFDKTYFALEATGLAYPVPLPPEDLLLKKEISEEELNKAAAWMRIYTDDYRFAPFPPEWQGDGRTEKITLEKVEGGRSYFAKLIQSAAKALNKSSENLFNDMQGLMHRYGHSADDLDYIRLEKIGFRISKDSDPYWRCNNCRRIHLHRELNFCTRCGTSLPPDPTGTCDNLQRDNFLGRRLRRSLLQGNSQENLASGGTAFRLRCEELTGQTIDPASRQREFKGIRLPASVGNTASVGNKHPLKPEGIEMLSVTTTMEVGIDIGPLEAIVQANMPPQRFNYQQRVGRAGRRGQAFSFVLTLCRSRSHDLHYFRHPESITGDAPPPPFLVKRLPRIAERLLCKDQLVAAFRWLEEKHRNESKGFWLGDLIKPVDVHGDFIPAAILKSERKEKWLQWLREALQAPKVQTKVRHTLEAMQRGNESIPLSLKSNKDFLNKITENIGKVGENTIGLAAHLANHGLLPMYGLPTRVRELVLGPSNDNKPTESLSRDLEIAIYEYAPGNVLVHDKKDHRCIGLTPRINLSFAGNKRKSEPQTLSNKPWDRLLRLGQCPKCWAWKEIKEENEILLCHSCQAESPLEDWNSKWCLEPAAFRTDFNPQDKAIDRLPGSSSNSLCADGKPPESSSWRQVSGKDAGTVRVLLTTSDSTTVYRLNQGVRRGGFDLSWQSGALDHRSGNLSSDDSKVTLKAQAIDNNCLSRDRELKKILVDDSPSDNSRESILEEPVYLAAPRVTDGLYILPQEINKYLTISCLGNDEKIPYFSQGSSSSLSGKNYYQGVRAAAVSASEILVSAAIRYLDIEHRALQPVEPRLFRKQTDEGDERLPMIQIVDEHVNGAGFSDWLGDGDPPPILNVLSNILNGQTEEWAKEDHKDKCQEACYRCLKSYDNQSLHGLLDWRLGLAYLRAFTDPSWQCGLDGDFSWSPLGQWPELSKRIRDDTLTLWNANKSENKKDYLLPGGLEKIYAFKLSQRRPWVIIRHPLWRWGLDEGPLAEFANHLDSDYKENGKVLCWDTFNLSRRPGRTRQWMAQQQPRRKSRRRRER